MAERIHIVIGGHLCMSPRGQREATVLQEAGYDVTISGIAFDRAMSALDREIMRRQNLRFSPALEICGFGMASQFRRVVARANGRLARARFRRHDAVSPPLLGYGARNLLAACQRKPADLTIVHSEAGLWVASELLQGGHRVGVDFEDWFSRDLPPEEQQDRPVGELARLEGELLHRASYRVASSRAMARALAKEYGVPEPVVVTNAFSWEGRELVDGLLKDRKAGAPLSLHWFSQTVGSGRGLELLFAALPLLHHPVQVFLRGACGRKNRAWLEGTLPEKWRASVKLLAPVPPWELPSRVAEHDIGLALETAAIPNRDLCLTNKFFQYLQAGLAVIATPTEGQREGMEPCPCAGLVLREASARALAEAITDYAESPTRLQTARRCALEAAAQVWNGKPERAAIHQEAQGALAK
jgi:glycosyltransferase involved in cell wall biosynthesis